MKTNPFFIFSTIFNLVAIFCLGCLTTFQSTFAQTNSTAQSVVSFTLVNADDATDILQITKGATLNLATLPTKNLSIRANTNPSKVGSVLLSLTGAASITRTENFIPYAMTHNSPGNYAAWTPPVGSYQLTATPYASYGLNGSAGASLTIGFSVIDQLAPVINSSLTATATQNATFTYQITALNNPTSFSASNLPAGLTVNSTGLISGKATTAGVYSVTIGSRNGGGSDSKQLALTVKQASVTTTTTGRTFYISSAGSDSNDGKSEATPWKTFSHVNNWNFYQKGDKVLLKAGEKFYGPLRITGGTNVYVGPYGTGANPIIYGDNSNVSWSPVAGHPGLYFAKLNLQTDGYAKSLSVYDITNHYTIVPAITTAMTVDQWLSTIVAGKWGFNLGSSSHGDEKVYIHTLDNAAPNAVHIYEHAVEVYHYASQVTIEHLDLRNCVRGVTTAAPKTIVRNCHIQDTLCNGILAQNVSYCEFDHNTLNRIGDTAIYLFKENHDWVHDNKISYTVDTILGLHDVAGAGERCGVGLQQGHDNLVENNQLDHIKNGFFDFYYETKSEVRYNYGFHAGTGSMPDGCGISFHHNIMDLDGGWTAIGPCFKYDSRKNSAPNAGRNLIFNNIFMNFAGYGLYCPYTSSKMSVFRNNIVSSKYDTAVPATFNIEADSDYNCYYLPNSTRRWSWAGTGYTFTNFKAAGHEVHSLNGNPGLGTNYLPGAASICIDNGQNLKTAGYTSTNYPDYDGATGPLGQGSDIGPFEQARQ